MFFKHSLMVQMEYRFNFFLMLLLGGIYVLVRVIFMSVIYKTGIHVNGLSPDSMLLHMGIFTVMSGLFGLLFSDNFFKISEHIRSGTLDSFITKPISCQFLVSFRNFNIGLATPDLIVGFAMIWVACGRLNILINPMVILGLTGLMISGLLVMYAIFLFPYIFCFWITRGGAINLVIDNLFELNMMPMGIYSVTMQKIGIFLIPLFIIPNFPTLFLLKKLSSLECIWAMVVPFVLLWIIRKFWNFGLKSYSSCSS